LNLACLPIPPHWLCKLLADDLINLQEARIIAIESLLASTLFGLHNSLPTF
jgi:hypothetical protein